MSEIATLHEPFAKWLRSARIPFINPRSDMESTIAPGHPDFTILARNCSLLIEFKDKDGKLSPAQEKRKVELEEAGNRVHVLRDLDIAVSLVLEWLNTFKAPMETPSTPRKLHRIGNATYEERDGQLHKIEQPGCRVVIGRVG